MPFPRSVRFRRAQKIEIREWMWTWQAVAKSMIRTRTRQIFPKDSRRRVRRCIPHQTPISQFPLALPPSSVLSATNTPHILHRLSKKTLVHVCRHSQTALEELPAILSSNLAKAPASGPSSNANVPVDSRRVPQVVAMGPGTDVEDHDPISGAVNGACKTAVFVGICPILRIPFVGNSTISAPI